MEGIPIGNTDPAAYAALPTSAAALRCWMLGAMVKDRACPLREAAVAELVVLSAYLEPLGIRSLQDVVNG